MSNTYCEKRPYKEIITPFILDLSKQDDLAKKMKCRVSYQGQHCLLRLRQSSGTKLHRFIETLTNPSDPVIVYLVSTKHIQVGHYRPISETTSEGRFADGPIVARDCLMAVLFHDSLSDLSGMVTHFLFVKLQAVLELSYVQI